MTAIEYKPCPVCGARLTAADADRIAVDRAECPRSEEARRG